MLRQWWLDAVTAFQHPAQCDALPQHHNGPVVLKCCEENNRLLYTMSHDCRCRAGSDSRSVSFTIMLRSLLLLKVALTDEWPL